MAAWMQTAVIAVVRPPTERAVHGMPGVECIGLRGGTVPYTSGGVPREERDRATRADSGGERGAV
jgi:hypothetical protein